MTDDDDWLPLLALLMAPTWKAREAALIVAGISPQSDLFPDDGDPHLVWLPASVSARWNGLDSASLTRRAIKCIQVAETCLYGLPPVMSPHAWIAEAERRNAAPPWLGVARQKLGLVQYLPPTTESAQSRRAKARPAARACDAEREEVRILWEAWVLGETRYEEKAGFISCAAMLVDGRHDDGNRQINANLIGEWITEWEREWFEPYGRIMRVGATGARGYGGHATTAAVKARKARLIEITPEAQAKADQILRDYEAAHDSGSNPVSQGRRDKS